MGASDDQPPDHSPFKVVCSVHDEVLIEREVGTAASRKAWNVS